MWSRRLLLPASLALYATLSACGSSESSKLADQTAVVDPFLAQMANPGEWTSEILRATGEGVLQSLGVQADGNDVRPATDFLVVKHEAQNEKSYYVFKIGCEDVGSMSAIEMRAAFGQIKAPASLDSHPSLSNIIESYGDKPRTLDCSTVSGTTTAQSRSFKKAKLQSIIGATADQTRVYLQPSDSNLSEGIVVDPVCETAILSRLGFGSRSNTKNKWSFSQDDLETLQENERIGLKCVNEQKISNFKELCDNFAVVTNGYDGLYFAFKNQFANSIAGANCSYYSKKVNDGIKASKTLNLSTAGMSGFPLKLQLLLDMSVLKSKPANGSNEDVWLDDITTIDLQDQKVSAADLEALTKALSTRTTGLTLKIRGLKDENGLFISDFNFLSKIAGNANITVDFSEDDVKPSAVNCPVTATNAQISSLCLKTVPFFNYCRKSKEGSTIPEAITAQRYLSHYEQESSAEIKDKDTAGACKALTQALVKRKTIILENAGISTLAPFVNLPNLEALIVPGNSLTSSAVNSLTNVPRLTELNIARNQIDQIPSGSNRIALTSLNIAENKLATLDGISNYKALSILVANNNPLTALTGLDSLSETMTYLDVSNTSTFGLQAQSNFAIVGKLVDLQFLNVERTGIALDSEKFAEYLGGKFNNLLYLNVSNNELSGDADKLANVSKDKIKNPLVGLVGSGTKLTNLQTFDTVDVTMNLPSFSAQTPEDAATAINRLSDIRTFYKYLYSELPEEADPFRGISLSGNVQFIAPELVFDKSAVNCDVQAARPPRAAKQLCGRI